VVHCFAARRRSNTTCATSTAKSPTLATAPNGTLYAGGGFTDIAGNDHDNLAAITP
jgi:hypothetical protein